MGRKREYLKNLSRSKLLKTSRGFTLVEISIAVLVFAIFMGLLFKIYKGGQDTVKITVWKQERNAELVRFWSSLRKHLEEATHKLDVIDHTTANPTITKVDMPLRYRQGTPDVEDSPILFWNISSLDFDSATDPVKRTLAHLVKQKTRVIFNTQAEGRPIRRSAALTDVESVIFTVNSIVKNVDKEEELAPGPDPAAEGTLLEISVTLRPPPNYLAADYKLVQSNKFRLNVGAEEVPNPDYSW